MLNSSTALIVIPNDMNITSNKSKIVPYSITHLTLKVVSSPSCCLWCCSSVWWRCHDARHCDGDGRHWWPQEATCTTGPTLT